MDPSLVVYQTLAKVKCPSAGGLTVFSEMNQLLMNYLVIEGYKGAAEQFSHETGIKPLGELAAIEERMQIRGAIQRGDISKSNQQVGFVCD